MSKKNKKHLSYRHSLSGNMLKVEIRDQTRRLEYRNKINLNDKNAVRDFLIILEKYSSFSIYDLLKNWIPI